MKGNKPGLPGPSFLSLGKTRGETRLWKIVQYQFDGLNKDLGRNKSPVMTKKKVTIFKEFSF